MEHTFSTGLKKKIPGTQTFEVVYFGEDEICEFELLEDYGKNDLKFLARVTYYILQCTELYVLYNYVLYMC